MEEGEGNVGNGFLASWSWGMDSGRVYWLWASPARYGLSWMDCLGVHGLG